MSKSITPLQKRILQVLSKHGGSLEYEGLLYFTYPPEQHPRAYRRPSTGGPPVCAMPLGRALRKLQDQGLILDMLREVGRTISLPRHRA